MKILVTGASGFIGFALSKKIAELGHDLTIVDNFSRGNKDTEFKNLIKKKNVKFLKIDLTSKSDFNKISRDFRVIYHLAAVNGTKNFYEKPNEVLRVNCLSTLNILEHFKNSKNTHHIFSSSSETYAGSIELNPNKIPTKENIELCINDISNVRFSYAASKILGESAYFSYSKKYRLSFNIIRFHNIYGPRMGFDHVIPELVEKIKKSKKTLELKGYKNTRSFCFIDDAVNALLLLLKKPKHKIIHIGNQDNEISILKLSKMILKIMKKNLALKLKNAPDGSVKRRCPNTKTLKSLGFKAKFNIEMGLHQTVKWYLNA